MLLDSERHASTGLRPSLHTSEWGGTAVRQRPRTCVVSSVKRVRVGDLGLSGLGMLLEVMSQLLIELRQLGAQ